MINRLMGIHLGVDLIVARMVEGATFRPALGRLGLVERLDPAEVWLGSGIGPREDVGIDGAVVDAKMARDMRALLDRVAGLDHGSCGAGGRARFGHAASQAGRSEDGEQEETERACAGHCVESDRLAWDEEGKGKSRGRGRRGKEEEIRHKARAREDNKALETMDARSVVAPAAQWKARPQGICRA